MPPRVSSGEPSEGELWTGPPPTGTPTPVPSQTFEQALLSVNLTLPPLVAETEQPTAPPFQFDELEADPTQPAEAGRLRRQTLLQQVVATLGPASTPSGAAPSPARPVPTSSPSSMSEPQLVAELEARSALAGSGDHFAVLGLEPGATREQVKTAFIGLAKVFHPDRLPTALPHLAQRMSVVFDSIREAYETLYDDGKRAAWEAMRQGAPARALAQSPEVAELMKEGEAAFKKRNYRVAEELFHSAHTLDGLATSLAAQAWAIYMDPSRKSEASSAKDLMQRALGLDPACDRAHYQLGVIARVEGDIDRAEKHFREAIKVNPRHLEANQELRLIDMRKKRHEPSQKKGFFR